MSDQQRSALLEAAGLKQPSVWERVARIFANPPAPPPTFSAQSAEPVDPRVFQPNDEGGGIFGHWTLDNAGLPAYRYELDQYADSRAAYPNTEQRSRRDHWHQIGNDRITALASNDGVIQVVLGDRGGVFLNHFTARDEALPPLPVDQDTETRRTLMTILRVVLRLLGRLWSVISLIGRGLRTRPPEFRSFDAQQAQEATTGSSCPRGATLTEPTRFEQIPLRSGSPLAGEYSFAGGYAYLDDGGEVWATAYRFRPHGADVERIFGLGYYETTTTHRSLAVRRRVYAPHGDHALLLADVEVENRGVTAVDVCYYEYWDANVHQLKLQLLRTDPFGVAGDEERTGINHLFLPQITLDAQGSTLRFHQQLLDRDTSPDDISDIDFAPADVFLADLSGTPDAVYVDKFAFFGQGGARRPAAVAARYGSILDAPSTDSMPYCMVLRRDLHLEPGEKISLRFAYGAARPGGVLDWLAPFRSGDWLAQTLDDWKTRLAYFSTSEDPVLQREMAWHSYYLLSATLYYAFYDVHVIPQGSAYLFLHGLDGVPRDQSLITLSLTYLRPDIARDILRFIMRITDHQSGAIPYGFSGYGFLTNVVIHDKPSDLDLFFLLALFEYVSATGDVKFLDEHVPFYAARQAPRLPPGAQGITVLDHVRAAVTHLLNEFGDGEFGLLKIGDGDWSDDVVVQNARKLGGVQVLAWFQNTKANGESVPNTQMALYVLPRIANLLADHDPPLVDQIRRVLPRLQEGCQRQWNGQWYNRAILRNAVNAPVILDRTSINLEAQPWALISDEALRAGTESALIDSVNRLLDEPSPVGATLVERGMVWPAVSHLLTWGYVRRRPDLAWRSLYRHTFAAHATVFPHIWFNIWSGPDGINGVHADNPGGTWYSPATPMTDFPVMNSNQHTMHLVALLRICGIEPTPEGDGLIIDPRVPRERFVLDTPLLKLETASGQISGEYRAANDGQRVLLIRLPAVRGDIEIRVGETVATQPAQREVRLNLTFKASEHIFFAVRWTP